MAAQYPFHTALLAIMSDEFTCRPLCISTTQALIGYLLKCKEFLDLEEAIILQEILPDDLDFFLASLPLIGPGVAYQYDLTLAVIAMVSARHEGTFFSRFLHDLSAVPAMELAFSKRVAIVLLDTLKELESGE